MIIIDFQGLEETRDWLLGLPQQLQDALMEKSQTLTDALVQKVQQKLSGEVLQSRSERLRDSIASDVSDNASGVSASVFVSGDIPYARILEYGGTTKAHIIAAVNSKVLAFNAGGKQVFARYINHPGSVIPEYSYLRSSLVDMNDEIVDEMGSPEISR